MEQTELTTTITTTSTTLILLVVLKYIIIIRLHRSSMYADVAYCYRQSSVVGLSVCLSQ